MRKQTVATIGIFDGVHRGHQKILMRLLEVARAKKTKSLVITFYPHPRGVLKPGLKLPFLTSLDHRIRLIKQLGVDFVFVVKPTKRLLHMKACDFIREVLVKKFHVASLIVGKTFRFGYKEAGDYLLLKKFGRIYGFQVFSIKPLKIKKTLISSTRIRQAIERGRLEEASCMLGREVSVLGTVIKGRRTGRRLGFPTANIDPHHEAIPPSGVYAVDVRIYTVRKKHFHSKFPNGLFKAVLNIGTRPTFFKAKFREPTIEIHIINFKKNIYGKDVEIIFKKKIRNEKSFSSIEALKIQIKKDIEIARTF